MEISKQVERNKILKKLGGKEENYMKRKKWPKNGENTWIHWERKRGNYERKEGSISRIKKKETEKEMKREKEIKKGGEIRVKEKCLNVEKENDEEILVLKRIK